MPAHDRKISEETELTVVADGDKFLVSDTLAATGGQAKDSFSTRVKIYILGGLWALTDNQARTISSGIISVTKSSVIVSAEGGPGADDLDTISGTSKGNLFWIRATAGHTITVKHGADNIFLDSAADKTLDSIRDVLWLRNYDGTNLQQVSFSNNT